jgi:hypothetical protein
MILKNIYNRQIRYTDERREHIEDTHPEMFSQDEKIRETLLGPDKIVRSRTDFNVELFYRHYDVTPVTSKQLCVVVKKILVDDFLVLTAYFTDTIKKGEILWVKK